MKLPGFAAIAIVLLAGTGPARVEGADGPDPSKAQTKAQPAGAEPVFNRARFYPAPGRERALVGGKFAGSNVSPTSGFETLAEIAEAPPPGRWSELSFPNARVYRWLRYEAPAGSRGAMAEVEFDDGPRKLGGTTYGPISDVPARGWRMAFDGKPGTWFEADAPDGQCLGLDLGDRATARTPVLTPKPGDLDAATAVAIKSPTPGATVRYTLDGTIPGPGEGKIITEPIPVDGTTTLVAVATREGRAPSPPAFGTYLVGSTARPALHTLHVGNSLTATTGRFAMYARTAGYPHHYASLLAPGAWTRQLWNVEREKQKDKWEKALADLPRVDHLTLQPRDFDIDEEADYDARFIKLIREKSPDVQPWLYCEWVEKLRQRPTDRGTVPSRQLKAPTPALTWEESMAAMLLYVEDLQARVCESDPGPKRPRVIPSALAMGWVKNLIDRGRLPGVAPGSFYPLLFADQVHPNAEGAYLVDLTWFAAFYRESPVGKVLPVGTVLDAEQASVLQRLAWDVVRNYPDCGLYEEGSTPAGAPAFSSASASASGASGEVTPVTLSSETPGAWFRYTLDGTTPTRTRGYVYCGVVSVRPGMTVKAVAYKSGMADSTVAEMTSPEKGR